LITPGLLCARDIFPNDLDTDRLVALRLPPLFDNVTFAISVHHSSQEHQRWHSLDLGTGESFAWQPAYGIRVTATQMK